jgi:UDP-N-acetylmuramate-alanine ligase
MSISTARLTAATFAGRVAGAASRLARQGTGASIRGKVMLKVDPGALAKLLAGKRIAVVSGTNGKTTTTHFLAAAVRASLGSTQIGWYTMQTGPICIMASPQR